MTARRYRDLSRRGDNNTQRSTSSYEGVRDFVTGQESITREKMENRRKIANTAKDIIESFQNPKIVAETVRNEKEFRLDQAKKGSTETYKILGALETKLRHNKAIDWNTIIVAAERNKDLTEALYDISQEIPDLRLINQLESSSRIQEHIHLYNTGQNQIPYNVDQNRRNNSNPTIDDSRNPEYNQGNTFQYIDNIIPTTSNISYQDLWTTTSESTRHAEEPSMQYQNSLESTNYLKENDQIEPSTSKTIWISNPKETFYEEPVKTRNGGELWGKNFRRGHKDNFGDMTDRGIYLQLNGTDIIQHIPRIDKSSNVPYTKQASEMMNAVSDEKVTPLAVQMFLSETRDSGGNRKAIGPWKKIKIVD